LTTESTDFVVVPPYTLYKPFPTAGITQKLDKVSISHFLLYDVTKFSDITAMATACFV